MRDVPIGPADAAETPASSDAQHGISKHNVGLVLAVAAGAAILVEAIWPGSAPQSESLSFWLPLAVISGCAFLLSAYLADKHVVIARGLLIGFGLALLASGIFFGVLVGGGARSAFALIADLLPGVLALAAAATVGPIDRAALP